jgi:hypothetical protein
VTGLLQKKLRATEADLERVCARVNGLARLSREMAEWERFDDSEA